MNIHPIKNKNINPYAKMSDSDDTDDFFSLDQFWHRFIKKKCLKYSHIIS